MVDGELESIWSQLHYATRSLSPVRLVLKVTLFLSPPEGGLDLVTNRKGAIFCYCIVKGCFFVFGEY